MRRCATKPSQRVIAAASRASPTVVADGSADSTGRVPDRLAVVRVETGESLHDVAVRVAPNAPTRQVADRIRELNGLQTPALAVGQTLIAPVG